MNLLNWVNVFTTQTLNRRRGCRNSQRIPLAFTALQSGVDVGDDTGEVSAFVQQFGKAHHQFGPVRTFRRVDRREQGIPPRDC